MFRGIIHLLKYDKRFLFGFIVIIVFIFLSILSFFSPYDLKIWHVVTRDLPPSFKYPLGTSSLGQDVFWKMTGAVRNSLIIAIIAASLSRAIAILVGLIAGYKGEIIDRILMSINDSFVVLPLLPLFLLILSVLGGSVDIVTIGIILGLFAWAWDARLIRSQILSLKERGFTYTAIESGMSPFKLVIREHLPFAVPLVMATIINNMIWAIGIEVVMAVFGLLDLETPTLGTMIHWSVHYQAMLLGVWWWILTPVIVCILLFLGLYMLFISMSQFLDPRTRLEIIKSRE